MIGDEELKSIEKLHKMKADGIISDEEFSQAKQQLLQGKQRRPIVHMPKHEAIEGNPAEDDYFAWMILPLRRYAEFEGRASRKEFWMFILFANLVALGMVILSVITFGLGLVALAIGLIAAFIPLLAVEVRRFHDQDKSGWLVLLNLIPYIGWIVVLIFLALPGTVGDNRYGPDPTA